MAVVVKPDHDFVTLLASTVETATDNGTSVRLASMPNAMAFTLDLTAAATDVGDTLDVYVQTMADGTNWVDVVHFTQCLGNGGALTYIAKIVADVTTAEFEDGAPLGAPAVRNVLGDEWRVRWAIVDAGVANASFTFSVVACPM